MPTEDSLETKTDNDMFPVIMTACAASIAISAFAIRQSFKARRWTTNRDMCREMLLNAFADVDTSETDQAIENFRAFCATKKL